MKYRAEIDGLRALAVIPVILYHAGFKLFGGGFVGVDVFFVISGYLITTIILAELEAGAFSLIHFYERRARRILPALFVVMFACFIAAWIFYYPQDMKQFSKSLVAVSAFSSNIFFWLTSGYFDTGTELKPLIHTWSLAVEEQYYLLFPLFLMLAWKLGKRWIVGLLAVVFVISLVWAQWLSATHPSFNFYMLPTRGWELLIGAFIAFYYARTNIKKHNHNIEQAGSLIGLLLIAYSIFSYSDKTPFPSAYALAPTLGAALIIIFATHKTVVGSLLSSKPFVAIGLISYSAYLWHQPMFAFARECSLNEPSMYLMSILAVVSFAFAYLSWKYVERPFRNKYRFSRKQVFIFAIVGTIFFVGLGYAGWKSLGYEFRLPEKERDSILFGSPSILSGSPNFDSSCKDLLGMTTANDEVCVANSKTPKILFAGDSHAMALFKSIYGNEIAIDDALLISMNSCPLYPNLVNSSITNSNNCQSISDKILATSRAHNSIKTVVLVNRMPNLNEDKSGFEFNGKVLKNREAFELGTDYMITKLLNMDKKVIYVMDVPQLKYHPRTCLQRLPLLSQSNSECHYTTLDYENERKDYVNEVIKLKKKYPSLVVVDPLNIFCDNKNCKLLYNNKSLYYDLDHISIYGSKLLLNHMKESYLLQ